MLTALRTKWDGEGIYTQLYSVFSGHHPVTKHVLSVIHSNKDTSQRLFNYYTILNDDGDISVVSENAIAAYRPGLFQSQVFFFVATPTH